MSNMMEKRIKTKKVQYACIDCGELSRTDDPANFTQSRENYRCWKCAIKYSRKPSIEKIQYTCIDCGQLSTWRRPNEFRQLRENYRCRKCATKYSEKIKRDIEKVQYICIDCGKLSKWRLPNEFRQPRENYRCYKCDTQNSVQKVQYACIDCGKLSRITYPSEFHQARENYRCQKCATKYNHKPSIEKVQYACIDCGKLSTWQLPSVFKQSQESYRCHKCAIEYNNKERNRSVEKVQYVCIDCGKLSRIKYPRNFTQSQENYRCPKCAAKYYRVGKRVDNVQYTCIDCGNLSTWRLPSEFRQPRGNYRCPKCAIKNMMNRLDVKEKREKRYKRITMACVDCGKEKTYIPSYFKNKNPYLCKQCMIKRRDDDPQYVKNKSIRMLKWHKEHPGAVKGENNGRYGVKESDESKKQNSLRIKKLYENKEFHDKVTKANRKAALNIDKRMKKSATDRGIPLSEWDGFVTPLNHSIRNCDKMRQWRFAVFKRDHRRDWFSGVACGKNAEAHHLIPFNKLLKLYKIKSLEQAINCDALWDVSNGVTMLKSSHDAYHSMWGNCYE